MLLQGFKDAVFIPNFGDFLSNILIASGINLVLKIPMCIRIEKLE